MPELASSLRELIDGSTPPIDVDAIVRARRRRRLRRRSAVGTAVIVIAAVVTGAVVTRPDHQPNVVSVGGDKGPWGGKDLPEGNGGQQVDQSQSASNSNSTSQSAESEAESEQENVNVPIAVNSPCSNNGDVDQSNEAENRAYSANHNDIDQDNWQNQGGAATAKTS